MHIGHILEIPGNTFGFKNVYALIYSLKVDWILYILCLNTMTIILKSVNNCLSNKRMKIYIIYLNIKSN